MIKIISILLFALFLEAKEHKFKNCTYNDSYMSPVEAEFAESECLGDVADYFQDLLHLKEREFIKRIPKELYADFNKTKKSWQRYVAENMYEYAYFVGGYPYVIEMQSFRITESLKRLDEIENLLNRYIKCDVKDSTCLKQQFASSDKELNLVYKDIMNRLTHEMKKDLRKTQRKWISFKERECSLSIIDAKDYYINTLSLKNNKIICQTKLTNKRLKELKMIQREIK